MKKSLFTILIFTFSCQLFAYAICVNDTTRGVEKKTCLPLKSEKACDAKGLDCFWLNYGEEGDLGGCSPAVTGYGAHCAQLREGHLCNSDQYCSWSGYISPRPPSDDPKKGQTGICAAVDEYHQATCSSKSKTSCSWDSNCVWVWP